MLDTLLAASFQNNQRLENNDLRNQLKKLPSLYQISMSKIVLKSERRKCGSYENGRWRGLFFIFSIFIQFA